MLCVATSDPVICGKIQRIEDVTVKIFRLVDEKPQKAPQIRRFMNYYLPTTLKLLHSYETLEKQGVNGENISAAKNDIERVLDTLAAGFEQQLDNLFKSDKLDISADIDVLENLMRQDGLTDEGNMMRTSGGV
jgi:5-bromo-4-chloroindolyl phosphate hydrolysis protein